MQRNRSRQQSYRTLHQAGKLEITSAVIVTSECSNLANYTEPVIDGLNVTFKVTKKVTVEPDEKYESNEMVAECMILAGEGAAKFAFKNQIPFPFVSQEAPEFPPQIPDGWAGSFAKIKWN